MELVGELVAELAELLHELLELVAVLAVILSREPDDLDGGVRQLGEELLLYDLLIGVANQSHHAHLHIRFITIGLQCLLGV